MVAQREPKVGQLKSKATLEDGILVVSIALTRFQVISEDGWIAREAAGVCRSDKVEMILKGPRGEKTLLSQLLWLSVIDSN